MINTNNYVQSKPYSERNGENCAVNTRMGLPSVVAQQIVNKIYPPTAAEQQPREREKGEKEEIFLVDQ